MEVKITKTYSTKEFESLNVPIFDEGSLSDMRFPIHLSFNKTYYKLENNRLQAFRILAIAIGRNYKTPTGYCVSNFYLVQKPNQSATWIADYINSNDIIFENKDDWYEYMSGNDKLALKMQYSKSVVLIANDCPNIKRNGYRIMESWAWDKDKKCPKQSYTNIKYILVLENEILFCLSHGIKFPSIESCIAANVDGMIIDDFEEDVFELNIKILPNKQKIRTIQIVEV